MHTAFYSRYFFVEYDLINSRPSHLSSEEKADIVQAEDNPKVKPPYSKQQF